MSHPLLPVCARLAAGGSAPLAPGLFFRTRGPAAADFSVLMGAMKDDVTAADIESAAATLKSLGATKLGITGFCIAGQWSWNMATRSATVSAAAGVYRAKISKVQKTPNWPTLLF